MSEQGRQAGKAARRHWLAGHGHLAQSILAKHTNMPTPAERSLGGLIKPACVGASGTDGSKAAAARDCHRHQRVNTVVIAKPPTGTRSCSTHVTGRSAQ